MSLFTRGGVRCNNAAGEEKGRAVMALATTEEQIAAVKQKLLQPGLSAEDVEQLEKILAILKEED